MQEEDISRDRSEKGGIEREEIDDEKGVYEGEGKIGGKEDKQRKG